MKICFLLGNFQTNGGIGRVSSIVANNLASLKGYSVYTISFYQTNKPLIYHLDKEVNQFHLFDQPISMTKAIINKHAVGLTKKILMDNDIDVLIPCGALFYPLGILACKAANKRCICWEHTNPQTDNDYKFQRLCRKYAVKKCDAMVVLTKAAERFYLEKLNINREKLYQIYNPIEKTVMNSQEYDESSKCIMTVGRLSYPKNMERLIDIAHEIMPQYPEWQWHIYGDGELRESLQKKIYDYDLENQVVLKGQVSDIYQKYKKYAFFVMTSRYEGFPMALIEAAANRLPLISFDIATGPNEIIKNNYNGYLIDHEDTETMISKIIELMNDVSVRKKFSQNAFKDVQRFELYEVIEKWRDIFQEKE